MRLKPLSLWGLAMIAGGCLAGLAEAPAAPHAIEEATAGGTNLAALWRLAIGVLGFALFFAGPEIAARLPAASRGRGLRASAVQALMFAAAFYALTLHWLYDGAIQFFGAGTGAAATTAIAVTLFLIFLALPFVALSLLLTAAHQFQQTHSTSRTAQWMPVLALAAAPAGLIALILIGHRLAFGFAWFEFGQWLLDFEWATDLLATFGARWSGLIPLAAAAALAPGLAATLTKNLARTSSTPPAAPPRTLKPIATRFALLATIVAALSYLLASPHPGSLQAKQTAHATDVRIALIAGVTPARGQSPRDRIALYLAETLRFAAEDAKSRSIDLILWPESVAGETNAATRAVIIKRLDAAGLDADLWFGGRTPAASFASSAGEGQQHNSIHDLRSGRALYHKRELVPFTEGLPEPARFFRWLLVQQLGLNVRNRELLAPGPRRSHSPLDSAEFFWSSPGDGAQEFANKTRYRVSTLICYESAFADLLPGQSILEPKAKAKQNANAGFILHAGNESWFASETLKRYTLRQARTRAIESGRPLVRIVGDGYSGLIDRRGRVARLLRNESGIVALTPAL